MTDATPIATPGATPNATPVAGLVDGGRADARPKVLGEPIFAADRTGPDLLHAMLATATIGRGRVTRVDTGTAEAIPGVRLVLTREDFASLQPPEYSFAGGYGYQSLGAMRDDQIAHRGQPIALVVADTLEAAIEAAHLVEAEYEPLPVAATLETADSPPIPVSEAIPIPVYADRVLGDADTAFAEAEIQVEGTFGTAPQHHNPMELFAATVEWRGDMLLVHDCTQNTGGVQHGLATVLGIDPAQVQVTSPYVGGSFGQKFGLSSHTPLLAVAARQLDRPIKLVRPRAQVTHDSSFRPASEHRVRIGGDRSGRLVAAIHETVHQTSRHDLYPSSYTEFSSSIYGWQHYRGRETLVQLDTQTPGYMRCPYDHIAGFAVESAVDEFAERVGMDPVDLRLANDTAADPVAQLPFASRRVAECLRRGAARFGWSGRPLEPGTMVAEDGSLVGWGVALGSYPTQVAPAVVRLRLDATGRATVRMTGHEMGQGLLSVVIPLVAGALGIPAEQVEVTIGATAAAPQHLTAGGWGTISSIVPLRRALDDLLAQVRASAGGSASERPPHEVLAAAGRDAVETEARGRGPGQDPAMAEEALATGTIMPDGPAYPAFSSFSWVAQFVEVRVDPAIRRVRVPRVVSAIDCGRVLNPTTATSQVWGGVVWGIGAALREASEVNPRYGGFQNANVAEYVVPVNADIGELAVEFIDQPDPALNSEGVKTLSNVVMSGVAPAIANAIYHATGRRQRRLPIRIEDLL